MTPVKGQLLPPPRSGVRSRIAQIRATLSPPPDNPLTQPELWRRLEQRYGPEAPSLTTVKRWEQTGRISADDAKQLADLAGCSVDWILRGVGVAPPEARTEPRIGSDARSPQPPHQETASGVEGRVPVRLTAVGEHLVGVVRDALAAAVERALARDELEHTRKGRYALGRAFLQLAVELQRHGMDAHEIVDVANDLISKGQP